MLASASEVHSMHGVESNKHLMRSLRNITFIVFILPTDCFSRHLPLQLFGGAIRTILIPNSKSNHSFRRCVGRTVINSVRRLGCIAIYICHEHNTNVRAMLNFQRKFIFVNFILHFPTKPPTSSGFRRHRNYCN